MILRDLIQADKKGYSIEFDINPHPRIKNKVCVNGTWWRDISLSTYKAFQKYKNNENIN